MPSDLETLPSGLSFCNITGGEPFIRQDVNDFIKVLKTKSKRIVISTNGYFTEKILEAARLNKDIGIRVSIEGRQETNDELRGLKDCYSRGLNTLKELRNMGIKDIGFGITLSDNNITDLMNLYELARSMDMEFATACVHNSFYFHKNDNKISRIADFDRELGRLIKSMLRSRKIKDWLRAYFNYGLLNYVHGRPRLLPCGGGEDIVFIDPTGDVMPCNAIEMSMGNIKKNSFVEIWTGKKATEVRCTTGSMCDKNCWMIGSASPAMKKNILKPMTWVIKNKLNLFFNKDIDLSS